VIRSIRIRQRDVSRARPARPLPPMRPLLPRWLRRLALWVVRGF
jgi:hypothetical protein